VTTAAAREGAAASAGFRRDLGWFSLLTMSLGTVIGSGWLILPAVVASQAGPVGILSWVFAGLCMLVIALVYAELGAAWPAAGAVALYPRLSHGSFTGHLAGWAAFVSYAIIPPAEAVAVTRYAGTFVPGLLTPARTLSVPGLIVAIVILALIGALNLVGVRYLAIFQNWVTCLKYIPIALFLVAVGGFAFHPGNFTDYGGFAPAGAPGFLLGTSATLFAYLGFRQALDFGAEARNPGRDLPLAVALTVIIATVTYLLIAIVFTGGIDWGALAGHGVRTGDWSTLAKLPAPLYDLVAAAGLGFVAALIFADGILSPNGPNATNVGTVPRVAYTMAENGTMPAIFLRLHPRYGTPAWGLLLCFVVEVFFLVITVGGYGELISAISVAFMVAYALGPVAFGVLRITAGTVERPFRLWAGSVWSPVAFVLASMLLYWSKWPLTGETLGVLFCGVILYGGYVLAGRAPAASVRYGAWMIVYLVAMAALSYLGAVRFGGTGLIPFGWDMVAVAAVAVAIYCWGVRQGLAYARAMAG
jgi:amino acid transporter